MKLENVRVEYSNEATINTGNFQNVKPGYTVSVDIQAGENPSNARDILKALVDGWLEEDIKKIREELGG